MESGKDFKAWLESYIKQLPDGERLPTDSELARQWQLSPRTVRRAMAPLREQGLLVRIPGKGTFKPSDSTVADDPAPEKPLASEERLAVSLAESIYRGELRRGDALPQVKFICLQYHVSEKTVAAAYRRLRQMGLVRKVGKRYWVGTLMPAFHSTVRKEVWVVVETKEDLSGIYTEDYMGPAYQKMERELRNCDLLMRYTTREEFPNLQRRWVTRQEYPVGLVFRRFDGRQWDEIAPLLKPLTGTVGQPRTSVLVDIADVGKVRTAPQRINVLARGNLTTNQSRATAGLIAGIDASDVVMLYDGAFVRQNPRYGYLRYYKTIYEILQATRAKRRIHQAIVTAEPDMDDAWLDKNVLQSDPGYVDYLLGKYASVTTGSNRVFDRTPMIVSDMRDLAKRHGRNTVWVCTRANLGPGALEALESRGIAVPKMTSVVTLDDQPQYYHLGLTACSPDWDLVGYLMAHAIIGDFPLERTHRRFIRIPCPPVERFTTPRR
jgi:DNA-binding transcriptional regulator YhcF (GntR family)